MPRKAEVWDETYVQDAVVGDRQTARLLGTIIGDVLVESGGALRHEGLITGNLHAEAGARVHDHGMIFGDITADVAGDVVLHGFGPMSAGYGQEAQFYGPDGWGELEDAWRDAVGGIESVIASAKLQAWADKQGPDFAAEEALRTAAAAIALSKPTDTRLWALLSAAIFNPDEDLQLRERERQGLWCPNDCRVTLPWAKLRTHFDSAPALFAKLLSSAGRTGIPRAREYHDAVWPLAGAVLAIGSARAPQAAVTKLEAYRAMVLQEIAGAARPRTVPKDRRRKPAVAGSSPGKRAGPASINTEKDPVDAALLELDSLIGLTAVKTEVRGLGGQLRVARERGRRGMPTPTITRHMIMTGNQGTGKTTVARLLGQIYFGYGLLERADVTEVNRKDLVGNHIGDTAKMTAQVFASALGGVLFIDEAYSLTPPHERDYGQEAIDTLVPLMENQRSDIMVVVAGYPAPMRKFLAANEGLAGRFGQTIRFPNYTEPELLEILRLLCSTKLFVLTPSAVRKVPTVLREVRKQMGSRFDNARAARRLFETAVKRHYARVGERDDAELRKATDSTLQEFLPADIPAAAELVPDVETQTGTEAA